MVRRHIIVWYPHKCDGFIYIKQIYVFSAVCTNFLFFFFQMSSNRRRLKVLRTEDEIVACLGDDSELDVDDSDKDETYQPSGPSSTVRYDSETDSDDSFIPSKTKKRSLFAKAKETAPPTPSTSSVTLDVGKISPNSSFFFFFFRHVQYSFTFCSTSTLPIPTLFLSFYSSSPRR